jgi:hypothetical protein
MLNEQIEDEKAKITSERLLSADEETEISFWTPVKMRGLEATDIRIFVDTQRSGGALFGRGNVNLTSEGGEGTSYPGRGNIILWSEERTAEFVASENKKVKERNKEMTKGAIGKIEDGKVIRSGAAYFHTKDHMGRWH